jgi:aryl-alcohol dehydrogenase-like predicted oxidoreductase
VHFPPLAVGTWAWGDRAYWGYEERFGPGEVVDAFLAAIESGIDLFDTAEVYGHGRSEQILGYMARRCGKPVRIATKFGLLPGRDASHLSRALDNSLRRLQVDRIDLYQVHWPDRAAATVEALMDGMAREVERGRVGAVGVSNFSATELREAHAALAKRGIPLASNQVRYSYLHRAPEEDGVLPACRELGVTLLAYSPLDQGLLAGKLDLQGPRGEAAIHRDRARAALEELRVHGPPARVALRWLMDRGVVPIVGATSGAQMRENASAITSA